MSDIAEKILNRLAEIETVGRLGSAPAAYVVDGRGNYFRPEDVSIRYDGDAESEWEAVQRRCAADREILIEALSWTHYYCGDSWYSCGLAAEIDDEPGSACANDDDRGRCTCGLEARQSRILDPLARGYGVTP